MADPVDRLRTGSESEAIVTDDPRIKILADHSPYAIRQGFEMAIDWARRRIAELDAADPLRQVSGEAVEAALDSYWGATHGDWRNAKNAEVLRSEMSRAIAAADAARGHKIDTAPPVAPAQTEATPAAQTAGDAQKAPAVAWTAEKDKLLKELAEWFLTTVPYNHPATEEIVALIRDAFSEKRDA
jgi:hypothetical protein